MRCPKCRKENSDLAGVCNFCGCSLTQDPVTTENTSAASSNILELPCREPGVKAKIDEFLEENSRKMAELYGEEFAYQKTWGP